MDVGLELRQARERMGVTLQQISHSTKISVPVLQAIEATDERRLPARVVTRSFVRTYAKEVGLDPEDTTRRYLEQFAQPYTPETSLPTPAASPTSRDLIQSMIAVVLHGRLTTPIVLAAMVIAIIALSIKNFSTAHSHATSVATPAVGTAGSTSAQSAPPSAAGTAGSTSPQSALPSAAGTAGSTQATSAGAATPTGAAGRAGAAPPAVAATPVRPGHLHLTIAPTGPCWVEATVDDEAVLAKLLDSGDRREVDTPSDVTLRVGDPRTFAFSINGQPARVAGTQGQAVTVHITKDNYAQFLNR
jgi:cytoskeleton protein RodZ